MSKIELKEIGQIARLGNKEEAKLFFEEYDIPYAVVDKGEYTGELKVKIIREADRDEFSVLKNKLEEIGYGSMCSRYDIFRDVDDNLVFIFSPWCLPFNLIKDSDGTGRKLIFEVPKIEGYESEINEFGVYTENTRTVIIRKLHDRV